MDHNTQTLLFFIGLIICGGCSRSISNVLVWSILCLGCAVNFLANVFILDKFDAAWEMLVLAAIDAAVIVALCRLIGNRLAAVQATLIAFAWIVHFCLYVDLKIGTSIVYESYETLILSVSAVQLLTGANGILETLSNVFCKIRDAVSLDSKRGCDMPSSAKSMVKTHEYKTRINLSK